MNTWNGSIVLLASLLLGGCAGSVSSRTYNFTQTDAPASQLASVAGDVPFARGVEIIRDIDGKDTRTHPLLKPYQNSQFLLAPQKVTVDPGDHTFGVLYIFQEVLFDGPKSSLPWGKYIATDLAINAKKKYAPDLEYDPSNRDHAITVKHFAKVSFHCGAQSSCQIYPVIDDTQADISFGVKECASGGHACVTVTSSSKDAKTVVVAGWSYTDI